MLAGIQSLFEPINIVYVVQISVSLLLWLCAYFASLWLWKTPVLLSVVKRWERIRFYTAPVVTYSLFLLFSSFFLFGFYLFSHEVLVESEIIELSFLLLMSHYAYMFFHRKTVYLFSFLTMFCLWGANKLGVLTPVLDYINKFSISLGNFHITPWGLLKAMVSIGLLFWGATFVAGVVRARIKSVRKIRTNTKQILYKSSDIIIYFLAGLVMLNILGINFSSLTFIGGAFGVGIGFGLQKITSNFISGIILLLEKSIEIDDLIEIDAGAFGFVRKLGARYTLIETYDGKEILVPNEDLITGRVTNWTFSSANGRVEIPVGVAYDSDIVKARELMLEAAKEHPQTLSHPEPKCLLVEFGDSSVNFELLFFIEDVKVNLKIPKSAVMFSIWEKFKEHNIEIPFPQQDIHIKDLKDLVSPGK